MRPERLPDLPEEEAQVLRKCGIIEKEGSTDTCLMEGAFLTQFTPEALKRTTPGKYFSKELKMGKTTTQFTSGTQQSGQRRAILRKEGAQSRH